MVSFNSIVQDIREVRIQGAQNIAKAAARAIGVEMRIAATKVLMLKMTVRISLITTYSMALSFFPGR